MKTIRKLKKFTKCKAMLIVALLGMSLGALAETHHIYIDVADNGTETPDHYKTFYAAVARANSVGGDVTIHLRRNTLETQSCTITPGVDIKLISDGPNSVSRPRHTIEYDEKNSYANARLIGMSGGTLTIGGNDAEGNKGVVIIRGLPTGGKEFYAPYSDKTWVLLYVSGAATLNILNNTEIAYGKNNIWLDSPTATVNLGLDNTRDFGVIHSAQYMNVNITSGTFNMNSGYIVGHCDAFNHGAYPYSNPVRPGTNTIMNRDAYIAATFPNEYLDMFDVSRALTDYYPTDTIDYNGKEYSNSMNRAIAVYAHCTTTASGEPAAVFNMNGGKICGIFAAGKKAIIGRTGGHQYDAHINDDDIYEFFEYNFESQPGRVCRPSAVVIYGGTGEISGGEMYADVSTFCGGGIIFSGDGFDATNFYETFDHGHFLISGGLINYCQANYGGAARSEYGVVLEMTGGKWSHCVANQGGGGVRVVCAKFIMSGTAEICYNHLSNLTENRNGGGIAGTWNPDFGHIYSWIELNGGKLYKNISDNYGGGLSAHDGGAAVDNGGIKAIIDGCEIYENTAVISGGGVFVGGNGDVTIKGDSYIHDNTAAEAGGGVYSSSEFLTAGNRSKVDISVCEISNNSAPLGGAVYSFKSDVEVHAGADIHSNTASDKGGGIYITEGADYYQDGGVIGKSGFPNTSNEGGGVYMNGGVLTMEGGTISYNTATKNETNEGGNGGGFYVTGGLVNVAGGFIRNNVADVSGGGFYVDAASTTDTTFIKGGATVSYNKAANGGGAYINQGRLVIQDAATNITADTATISGGGIYMANGTVTYTDATMEGNTAMNNNGGGLYLGNGTMTVSGTNATFSGNKAKIHGGGVYVGGGSFTMTGGTIGGTIANGNKTTGNTSYGGGLYMGGGTATITGGTISGNHTDSDGMGGGIYMDGGTCTLSGGATIGGSSLAYANNAKYGGGIYSANGTITVKGGAIGYNSAVKGGGIYTNGNKAKVYVQKDSSKTDDSSYIEYNTAQYGGGIYGEKGLVEFSDGYIQYNTASEAGGGIYVDANDTLYLKGSANMLLNGVPTGHKGGGVYLVGSLIVGEQTSTLGTILAQDNYAYTTTQPDTLLNNGGHVADSLRNNVYLPNPVVHEYGESTHAGVIEVVENGISNESHVGFSVPHGNVPVIYCIRSSTSWGYLHRFSTGQTLQFNLFDDSGRYKSVQYSNDPAFNPDHVYLYGFWSDEVTGEDDVYCEVDYSDFVGQDTIYISNPCQLAFFISWVNGRETPTHLDAHPNVCAKLMDDIDMHEFGWVPIGTVDNAYSGVFDGNGHTVSGIRSLLNEYHTNYGFFGNLADGAVVKNLFLKEASFHIESKEGYTGTMYIGGVAGLTNGNATIDNCETESVIVVEPDNTNTVMGGLVGKTVAGDQIKSSIGIADMTGFLMGGLAGQNNGSILNSFSNAKFTKASSHTEYMGGLVGDNEGLVENCYSRVRVPVPATNYFGYLAGDNDGGTLKYSYARQNVYVSTEGTAGTQTGIGTYGDTQLPYLYGHRDTQVEATNPHVPTDASADKQLMIVLNKWVEAPAQASGNYTKWGRPWQESDAQKPLNDDYPILRMPMANAVASSQGDPYLDYNDIDVLLESYQGSGEAIWMYSNDTLVTGDNEGSSAKLYIAEDVVLLNDNPLKAYVGITLDNSAGANGGGANPTYGSQVGIETDETDWHMISTSLSDAPIGINYSDNGSYDFSWGHPEGMPYYLFYPKGNPRNGYFPSHRFGKDYPTSDATIEAGSYYNEWDFYAYSEPNYHWINFKRNSTSHHHFDTEGHDAIEYHNGDPLLADDLGNESRLVPGKGYFAATREETFLQCQGHLNADEVTIGLTHTPNIPRHGYNLIGNPYQAYLNFDAFAEANSDDWDAIWDDVETASYTILDEDELDLTDSVETVMGRKPVFYKSYSYGCSDNPDVSAGGFIHPHQGFFVRLEGKADASAYFYPDQRNASDTVGSKFRGVEHIDYPLVNLFAIEGNGAADVVTVELGRPDEGGAPLMQGLRVGNGKIWCHYNDKDYAIAYTQPGITEAAIRFESVKDTEYTMRWTTRNGEFSYLHLIDNKTGADVDCLTTDEYKFSASTSDYKSRFRLVFGYTGIEEDTEAEANENFAFMMNDELVVTGEGVLQVFDVTGRMVTSQELHGVQTRVSLPAAANGVYVLRLTEGKQSRIQKMVISK